MQHRKRGPGDADPAEFLRPFVALAMDPEYQARRIASEAQRKADQAERRARKGLRS
jgi:hypothetical protein